MIDYTQFGAQPMAGAQPTNEEDERRRRLAVQQPAQPTNAQPAGPAPTQPPQPAPRAPQAAPSPTPSPASSPTFAQMQAAGIPRPAPPQLPAPAPQAAPSPVAQGYPSSAMPQTDPRAAQPAAPQAPAPQAQPAWIGANNDFWKMQGLQDSRDQLSSNRTTLQQQLAKLQQSQLYGAGPADGLWTTMAQNPENKAIWDQYQALQAQLQGINGQLDSNVNDARTTEGSWKAGMAQQQLEPTTVGSIEDGLRAMGALPSGGLSASPIATDQGGSAPMQSAIAQMLGATPGTPQPDPRATQGAPSPVSAPSPGSPTPGTSSGGSNSPLGGNIMQVLQQLLQSPTAYGTDAMQREYAAGGRQIDDDFALQQKALTEEMARRGLSDSSIAGGNLSDLNVGRRSAQEELMNNLLMKRADTQDSGIRSALSAAMGYDSDTAGRGFQQQQLAQQGSQFDRSLGLDTQRFTADQQNQMNQFLMALFQMFGGTDFNQ